MKRTLDRLCRLVVVVLCVGVICASADKDLAVSRADSRDVFAYYAEIDGYGFRSVTENRHVEFEVAQGPKGLHATHVCVA